MSTGIAAKTRPGPKAQSVAVNPRSLNSLKIQPHPNSPRKTRKSYTREFKLQALTMLRRERVDERTGQKVPCGVKWVARQLGITKAMLRGWVKQEEKIVASRKGSRQVKRKIEGGTWAKMEQELHKRFLAVRAEGMPVGKQWILSQGKEIYEKEYPEEIDVDPVTHEKIYRCRFSNGWFEGFCMRWNITWRHDTKLLQEDVPTMYH